MKNVCFVTLLAMVVTACAGIQVHIPEPRPIDNAQRLHVPLSIEFPAYIDTYDIPYDTGSPMVPSFDEPFGVILKRELPRYLQAVLPSGAGALGHEGNRIVIEIDRHNTSFQLVNWMAVSYIGLNVRIVDKQGRIVWEKSVKGRATSMTPSGDPFNPGLRDYYSEALDKNLGNISKMVNSIGTVSTSHAIGNFGMQMSMLADAQKATADNCSAVFTGSIHSALLTLVGNIIHDKNLIEKGLGAT